jgi:VIT1/CCC1 family predicted Fe2+/Mn2+ transporter
VTFAVGAALPVVTALLAPASALSVVVTSVSLLALAVLGAVAGKVGGASLTRGALRVVFWGALAMAVTAGVGRLFGAPVA